MDPIKLEINGPKERAKETLFVKISGLKCPRLIRSFVLNFVKKAPVSFSTAFVHFQGRCDDLLILILIDYGGFFNRV